MIKRLLLPMLLAPLAIGCGSDDSSGNDQPESATYLLEIPESNWTDPKGFGPDVGSFVTQFLIQVEGNNATVGLAHEGVQDTCSKTVTLPKSGNTIGPADYEIYLPASENATGDYEGVAVVASLKDFTLSNVLPNGDTPAEDGMLSVQADARDLWPLFYIIFATSAEDVCNTIESGGEASCEECSDGESLCLTLKAASLGATAFSGEFQDVPESCPEMLPPE